MSRRDKKRESRGRKGKRKRGWVPGAWRAKGKQRGRTESKRAAGGQEVKRWREDQHS